MTAFWPCTTADTGWRPHDDATNPDFQGAGRELGAELKRWTRADAERLAAPGELREEMGAVLDGCFEIVCEDERYELRPGDGILIPHQAPRTWRLLSEDGTLYRVFPLA